MVESLKNYTILYAEDEDEVRQNYVEYLSSYFKAVYSCADGAQALATYHKFRPDVLLLDVSMPEMDGLEVAREVRKEDKEVRIMMLTAHTEQERLLQAVELGLTRYLLKPLRRRDFKEALEKVSQELQEKSEHICRISAELIWDFESFELYGSGDKINLTSKESKLLNLFCQYRQQGISVEDIMCDVWNDKIDEEISFSSVKTLINALRKKIGKERIENIYGSGYRLVCA